MPKAVWKGSLNLGLVNIPVSLHAATEPKDVRFHLVDKAGRRVRYRRFVEMDGDREDHSHPQQMRQRSVGSLNRAAADRGDLISKLLPDRAVAASMSNHERSRSPTRT